MQRSIIGKWKREEHVGAYHRVFLIRHYLTPAIPLLWYCRSVSICSVAGFPQRSYFDLINLKNVFTRQPNPFVASLIAVQDYRLSLAADPLLSCLRYREPIR